MSLFNEIIDKPDLFKMISETFTIRDSDNFEEKVNTANILIYNIMKATIDYNYNHDKSYSEIKELIKTNMSKLTEELTFDKTETFNKLMSYLNNKFSNKIKNIQSLTIEHLFKDNNKDLTLNTNIIKRIQKILDL